MACCCCPKTVIPNKKKCPDCLVTASYIVGVNAGITTCGDTYTVDVSTDNDYSVCDDNIVYSIDSYDERFFDTPPTIDSDGIISGTTNAFYGEGKVSITYKVECPGSILSSLGCVYINLVNPCPDCPNGCNPCTTVCFEASDCEVDEAQVTVDPDCDKQYSVNILAESEIADCPIDISFVYSDSVFSNVKYQGGVVKFNVNEGVRPNTTQEIRYYVNCDLYELKDNGVIKVHVKSACDSVTCPDGFDCDTCGKCVQVEPEIIITTSEQECEDCLKVN